MFSIDPESQNEFSGLNPKSTITLFRRYAQPFEVSKNGQKLWGTHYCDPAGMDDLLCKLKQRDGPVSLLHSYISCIYTCVLRSSASAIARIRYAPSVARASLNLITHPIFDFPVLKSLVMPLLWPLCFPIRELVFGIPLLAGHWSFHAAPSLLTGSFDN